MLTNFISREVIDLFKIKNLNQVALKAKKHKISKDKRKKEWIITKENSTLIIGKVISQTKKRFSLAHWEIRKTNNALCTRLVKCKGCKLSSSNHSECIISRDLKKWHQVLREVEKKEENIAEVKVPLSAYLEQVIYYNSEELDRLNEVRVKIPDLEEAIIQRVIEDKLAQEELVEIARKLEGRKKLNIYTDGSLVGSESSRVVDKRMRIGWVLADESSNRLEDISFCSRIEDWPSSTRAELGAIWTAVLAAPRSSLVNIFTDSKAAIEGLQANRHIVSIRNIFKIKNRSLIRQIQECCKAKNITLQLNKVKGHSENLWNDKADKIAKEGLSANKIIRVKDVSTDRIRVLPKWEDKLIDCSIRSFVNITTAITYEVEWSKLSNSKDIASERSENSLEEALNWKSTWNVLRKYQGKKCVSLKKSKTLIFRIKCLNKLLPTRDICYQRNPKLYETKTCVACYVAEETFSYLAECEMYQRIWKHTEEIIIQELTLQVLEEWNMYGVSDNLKKIFLGIGLENKTQRRKLHLRGFTNKQRVKELKELLGSNTKANKVTSWFIDLFWTNFYEKVWKFRCEVMAEWEKKNEISLRKKKRRKKTQVKNYGMNKENSEAIKRRNKEINLERKESILRDSRNKIANWVKGSQQEEWLKFKNK
jgi:ribonuclease HI